LKITPDREQVRAYLALWRHIGYYLGVAPDILTQYFSDPATADKFLASVTLDLFSSDEPLDPRTIPTIPILRAASNRPPSGSSLEHNCAVTRYLAGDELADHLGLPQTSLFRKLRLYCSLLVQRLPVWFETWYPRQGWAQKRRAVMREGLPRTVRWNLGMRRTSFRPRTDVRTAAGEGEGGIGGELADGVKDAEAVTPDLAGSQRLTKMWKEVIAEMVGVCIGLGVLTSATAWMLISQSGIL
jgi:hypothetical protein